MKERGKDDEEEREGDIESLSSISNLLTNLIPKRVNITDVYRVVGGVKE